MKHVLFNPLANNRRGYENAMKLKAFAPDAEYNFVDLTEISDHTKFFESIPQEDDIILTGGDGTLNRFINALSDCKLTHLLYYYPAGSGNDFMNDVKADAKDGMVILNDYIPSLPIATIKGKEYKFLNGIGYGVDGYCCEEGDAFQKRSNKKVNYTTIALKGILWRYKPTSAKITVDGVTKEYDKVWMIPTMKGRFFGGGMMITPNQDRKDAEGKVTVVVLNGASRLKILSAFPKIFKGTHIGMKELDFITGHDVKVEYNEPRPLQIDGETVTDVLSYTVRTKQ